MLYRSQFRVPVCWVVWGCCALIARSAMGEPTPAGQSLGPDVMGPPIPIAAADRVVVTQREVADEGLGGDGTGEGIQKVAGALPGYDARESLPLGVPARANPSGSKDRAGSPASPEWVMQTAVALGAVLGLIFLVRYGLTAAARRSGGLNNNAALEVLGRVTIAPRQQVMLLRLGYRVIVVGDSPSGLRTLAELTDPEEVSSVLAATASDKPASITRGFNDLIRRFTSDYSDNVDDGGVAVGVENDRYGRARDGVQGLLSKIRTSNREGVTRG